MSLDSRETEPLGKPTVLIGLNAVIVAVTEEVPRILTVKPPPQSEGNEAGMDGDGLKALPFGTLDPARDRTLELCLRGWVERQTGLQLGYAEQLYTFGDRFRDLRERRGGARVVSVAYLALVHEQRLTGSGEASWWDVYRCLPWEDWRSGRPSIIEETVAPVLTSWAREAGDPAIRSNRRERVDIGFGLSGAPWDSERVLERFEILYEARLVHESFKDLGQSPPSKSVLLGQPMALDHRRILATALGRVRGKLKYRPVVFELLAPTFSLLRLQRVVEALVGVRLHKQNFRRLVEKGGLVEGTGQYDSSARGRPAELFRFRREVLRERPTPGVGLPAVRRPIS